MAWACVPLFIQSNASDPVAKTCQVKLCILLNVERPQSAGTDAAQLRCHGRSRMPQQASCGWHGRSMHIFHERSQPERLHQGGSGRGMNAEPASSFVPLKIA